MTERSSSALFEEGDKYLLLDDTHTAQVSEKGLFFGTRRPLTEGATGADIAVDGIRLVPSKKISVTCSSPCAAVVSISLEHDLKGTETDKDGVDEEETSWRALAPWKRESLTFDADTGAVPVTSRHAAAEEIALEGVTNEDEDILYSENEPKPEVKLLMHPKISLTPHIGAATLEAQDRIGVELGQQIISILG